MSKERKTRDALERVDFESMFPDTPPAIHDAVRMAGHDIRRYEWEKARRRRRSIAIGAAAAALVIAIGIGALWRPWAGHPREDVVVPPVLSTSEDPSEVTVYASKTDPFYHRDEQCPDMEAGAVALPLVTAREFEKAPCPRCGK